MDLLLLSLFDNGPGPGPGGGPPHDLTGTVFDQGPPATASLFDNGPGPGGGPPPGVDYYAALTEPLFQGSTVKSRVYCYLFDNGPPVGLPIWRRKKKKKNKKEIGENQIIRRVYSKRRK